MSSVPMLEIDRGAEEARAREAFEAHFPGEAEVRLVRAPYRICPLGAHIDHQLGPVSSIATDQAVLLAFAPADAMAVCSTAFEGRIEFPADGSAARARDWADYARGAVSVLQAHVGLRRGIRAMVLGELDEAGLSSSAAVGLAYLTALAHANEIELDAQTLVELDRRIENDFMGLKNGILDPASIAHARAGHLTVIDCDRASVRHVAEGDRFEFLAFHSGVREPLVGSSKFNNRVQECLDAGGALARLAGAADSSPRPLGSIARDDWERFGDGLTGVAARRAAHYFDESARVLSGAQRWAAGDAPGFGELMKASARSSIHQYETGCPELIRLYELLADDVDVHGARFSGAGFRGCAVALVRPGSAGAIAQRVGPRYLEAFPEHARGVRALCTSASKGLELR